MGAFPGHGAGILDHGIDRIQQGSIPMLFYNPPTAFDRVVFTMVWGILRQTDGEVIAQGKLHQTLHELRAPTVALRAIVQIDEQGPHERKALFDRLPPVDQAIHQAIAGHFGRHPREKEFIGGGQENAHRRHRRCWMKIVVSGLGGDAILPPSCEGTDLDDGFGIQGEPEHLLRGICLFIALLHLSKDGIGLGDFFWGWLLATFFGK